MYQVSTILTGLETFEACFVRTPSGSGRSGAIGSWWSSSISICADNLLASILHTVRFVSQISVGGDRRFLANSNHARDRLSAAGDGDLALDGQQSVEVRQGLPGFSNGQRSHRAYSFRSEALIHMVVCHSTVQLRHLHAGRFCGDRSVRNPIVAWASGEQEGTTVGARRSEVANGTCFL